MGLGPVLCRLRDKEDLSAEETQNIFDQIFAGDVPEDHIAALLLALHRKGETPDEILGAATSMRQHAVSIHAPEGAIDIVGTGGDGIGTFNISTAAAIIVAACGVPVAKHGNRAATSKSGSSDVLAALGVNLSPPPGVLETCLREINLCFLFAQNHHPSMRFVAPVRKKLGVRTIFNLLGPLTNPANVKRHMVGVFSADLLVPMATVLHHMGSESAWLVHGQDGMDEITTVTETDVAVLKGDKIFQRTVSPSEAGIALAKREDLCGGDAQQNAQAVRDLFDGKKDAYRDIVAINAAAALIVGEKARDLKMGVDMVVAVLDSGAARHTLERLVALTNGNAA